MAVVHPRQLNGTVAARNRNGGKADGGRRRGTGCRGIGVHRVAGGVVGLHAVGIGRVGHQRSVGIIDVGADAGRSGRRGNLREAAGAFRLSLHYKIRLVRTVVLPCQTNLRLRGRQGEIARRSGRVRRVGFRRDMIAVRRVARAVMRRDVILVLRIRRQSPCRCKAGRFRFPPPRLYWRSW